MIAGFENDVGIGCGRVIVEFRAATVIGPAGRAAPIVNRCAAGSRFIAEAGDRRHAGSHSRVNPIVDDSAPGGGVVVKRGRPAEVIGCAGKILD